MAGAGDPVADALGDMGLWQLRGVLLVSLVKVPSAWFMASIVYIAPTPTPGQFWCARPALFRHWGVQQWLDAFHPPHPRLEDRRDPCYVYDVTTGEWDLPNRTAPFNNASLVPCPKFEFLEGPNAPFSIVTQWHLVCQKEVLVGVSQLFYLLGMLFGGVICSFVLSRFSPRRILLVGMLLQIVAGASTAYVPLFELHLALRFLTAVAFAHLISCGYLICTDITGGTWRTVVGACYENFWTVGVLTLPFLSGLFMDSRDLQVTISLPTVLLILLYRWMPDSPRWLLTHGYVEEAQEILKEAAMCNGLDMPAMEAPKKTILSSQQTDKAGWWSLFRPPNSKLKVCCLHIVWAATVVSYYGGLLNVRNLGSKVPTNTVIAGVAEIVGVLLALWLLWCKKRWLILGLFLLMGGTATLLCWTIPLNAPWTRNGALVALAMADRVPIACSLTVLQVGSPQVLEQEFRPIAMLSCVTFARAFLLTAPFIAGSASMFGEYVSLSIFAVITIAGGIASLLLECACQQRAKYKCTLDIPAVDKTTNGPGGVSLQNISISANVAKKTESTSKAPEIT